ncbi:hypothetical protein [Phenylobacterium sp.]|jgi:hypothetical protein|uniref:hypothetical protein n=1 Tax=Phenylobacterium sp. TaxID=1871053 RepID=UPI002F92D19B
MTAARTEAEFPAGLVNWAGHRSGGVRRLFDEGSGRPGGLVLETNLLNRLEAWARAYPAGGPGTPRIILLVGGPGNGKTEAIESTIRWLDEAVGCETRLVSELARSFSPEDGLVPRLVEVDLRALGASGGPGRLALVQDATAVTGTESRSAAQLLLHELATVRSTDTAYLCCVNRGVLDDALIEAIDIHADYERLLLEAVTRAVSLFPDAPACWPLQQFPHVAVWPMDAESLLVPTTRGGTAPAQALLAAALDETRWGMAGSCGAGPSCPFCNSREHLSRPREREALLRVLRWYEIASGKRWSFRDLFSVVSYLLAGHRMTQAASKLSPCEWAATMLQADEAAKREAKPTKESSTAIFQLVAAQYQHALFHSWDREAAPSLGRDIRELGLDTNNTAVGLQWFLTSRRSRHYLPATIASSLDGVAELLDPALAESTAVVQATQRTHFALRELDVRFSRSVAEGIEFIRRLQAIPNIEMDLLERLRKLDALLSESTMRRKRPEVAARVQRLVRDFACRVVRRTLGARTATVPDAAILAEFQRVSEDEQGSDLYDVAREVERLLNKNQDFEVSLTTTFGQPLPPAIRRATLVVPARQVKPLEEESTGRPRNPLAFLSVGGGKSSQAIALTYDLFKATKELARGMSPASLPRTVLALMDTTRARLAGPIVRDPDILDRARIVLGAGGVTVEERRQGFIARKLGATR